MEKKELSVRIPLYIDAALLLLIVFQGGVTWQQVHELTIAVERIQLEQRSATLPAVAVDRLARIETKLDRVTVDVKELSDQVARRLDENPQHEVIAGIPRHVPVGRGPVRRLDVRQCRYDHVGAPDGSDGWFTAARQPDQLYRHSMGHLQRSGIRRPVRQRIGVSPGDGIREGIAIRHDMHAAVHGGQGRSAL